MRGCEFRSCGIGVAGGRGTNLYVLDTHFERSSVCDVKASGEVASSVRRCTSMNPAVFVYSDSWVAPMTIQDCRVDGWSSGDGAIIASGPPIVVIDSVFTHPPSTDPVLRIGQGQQAVVAGNLADGVTAFANGPTCDVPGEMVRGVLASAATSFLLREVRVPGKVFDAKRDFGAVGDGIADDTNALEAAIAAARAWANGAIAYLPCGRYAISRTLTLSGRDYRLGGSGFRTGIVWKGAAGGTMIEVRDPDRITLENLSVGQHDFPVGGNDADIRQTGSGSPSLMCYDRVRVFGLYDRKPLEHGLRLDGLGAQARVLLDEVQGNVRATDSAAATIFIPVSYEGTLVIDGRSPGRGGFIGGDVRLGTCCDPVLWVKDNQSLVMSDFYTEQSDHFVRLDGSGDLPAGRVTMCGAKVELGKPENTCVEVAGYRGDLFLGAYEFYPGNPIHRFAHSGDASFAVTVWASCFYRCAPQFTLGPSASASLTGCYLSGEITGPGPAADPAGLTQWAPEAGRARLHLALDDLRRLSAVDLEMSWVMEPRAPLSLEH